MSPAPARRIAAVTVASALALGGLVAAAPAAAAPAAATDRGGVTDRLFQKHPLRVATFNASLNRTVPGDLVADLSTGENAQARTVAEIIQRSEADVILLNEFDYADGAIDLFRDNYLEVSQNGAAPVDYAYAYVAPSNTGVPSGYDLNNDGTVGGPDDALGFGTYEGQYGMAVLSKHPIDTDRVRTFQNFRWQDMPGALLPDDPATATPADWYSPEELAALPLSSKSHWDVPVEVGGAVVHVLAAHPTPPTFDGAEDRNGRRNHDEIRFWADYVSPGKGGYIVDDQGGRGGLRGVSFVIAGDLNADPSDGDSVDAAVSQLLTHWRIRDPKPRSEGAVEAAALQGGANAAHTGDPAIDTADFADTAPGNLRADYVLPSNTLPAQAAGVFWPVQSDPLSALTGVFPFPASDHRLVWVDVRVPRWGR